MGVTALRRQDHLPPLPISLKTVRPLSPQSDIHRGGHNKVGDRTKVKVRSTKTTDKQAEKRKHTLTHTKKENYKSSIIPRVSWRRVGLVVRGGLGGLAELV